MKEYLVNLTDNLIRKNHYCGVWERVKNHNEFLDHVKFNLDSGDVHEMNPETLGRIMASFEIGNVMSTKKELFEKISFCGNCEEMLRELVSLCLAYVIRDRLDERRPNMVPPYKWPSLFKNPQRGHYDDTVPGCEF